MARRDEPDGATDPTRREFFRTFGRQTVRNAGAVIGAAAELRRAGGSAARELLDLGSAGSREAYVGESPPAQATVASFSSAYRLGDDSLLLLDQRDLPGRMTVLTCREPTEVASAIRLGVVTAGPILGEICAYALVITAARPRDATATSRDQAFRAAANTLRVARREVHALPAAVSRMESRYDSLTADSDGVVGANLAAALRAEADAVATEAQLAHAALGRSGAQVIAGAAGEQMNLIMHGDMSPLSCGLVGTGTAILRSLLDLGRQVHVWLTEGAPSMEGARVGSFELTQMDVPHTVIPDTAVGWLLSSREIDAALVRGDTICGNKDTVAPIGSLSVARLASDAGVPVHVVAPSTAFDPDSPDGNSVALDVHSPAELTAHTIDADNRGPAVVGYRLSPGADVVPASLATSFLTEAGPRPGGRR